MSSKVEDEGGLSPSVTEDKLKQKRKSISFVNNLSFDDYDSRLLDSPSVLSRSPPKTPPRTFHSPIQSSHSHLITSHTHKKNRFSFR
jgi:hypothetical protein